MKGKIESIETIRKKYPDEWLLIIDYETDDILRPVRGILVEHSKHRSDIYEKLQQYRGKVRIEYSGDIPKDVGVLFCGQNRV